MDRVAFAKKLAGLDGLMERVNTLHQGDTLTQLQLGLMTTVEHRELQRINQVETEMYRLGYAAEKAIPFPVQAKRDQLLAAYLKIVDRIEEIEPDVNLVKKTWDYLLTLSSHKGYRWGHESKTTGERLGVDRLGNQALEMLQKAEDPLTHEYNELKVSRDFKTREGSIARRVNNAAYDEWQSECRQAKATVMDTFRENHAADFTIKDNIEAKIEERRQEQLKTTAAAIRALLSEAVKESK